MNDNESSDDSDNGDALSQVKSNIEDLKISTTNGPQNQEDDFSNFMTPKKTALKKPKMAIPTPQKEEEIISPVVEEEFCFDQGKFFSQYDDFFRQTEFE